MRKPTGYTMEQLWNMPMPKLKRICRVPFRVHLTRTKLLQKLDLTDAPQKKLEDLSLHELRSIAGLSPEKGLTKAKCINIIRNGK